MGQIHYNGEQMFGFQDVTSPHFRVSLLRSSIYTHAAMYII